MAQIALTTKNRNRLKAGTHSLEQVLQNSGFPIDIYNKSGPSLVVDGQAFPLAKLELVDSDGGDINGFRLNPFGPFEEVHSVQVRSFEAPPRPRKLDLEEVRKDLMHEERAMFDFLIGYDRRTKLRPADVSKRLGISIRRVLDFQSAMEKEYNIDFSNPQEARA